MNQILNAFIERSAIPVNSLWWLNRSINERIQWRGYHEQHLAHVLKQHLHCYQDLDGELKNQAKRAAKHYTPKAY